MQRAIEIAENGIGTTSPNPIVGAVLVKDGQVIGEGFTRPVGGKHAEVVAIQSAQKKHAVQGSTLYTTLEPCSHYGRTPPCTDLISSVGIKRVVFGMTDPDKRVNGKGLLALSNTGVHVHTVSVVHPMYKRIRSLNQSYIKWMQTSLPYVCLKVGMSLDGKIATKQGHSKWITNELARTDARLERSIADAVLVGSGTVLADDPELAAHGSFSKKNLTRVIIDSDLRLDLKKKVFRDKHVILICTEEASASRRRMIERQGFRVEVLGNRRVSIKKLLQFLGKEYIQHLYVEGGAGVHGSFYDETIADPLVVDEFLFYISPKIIGGTNSIGAIAGQGIEHLDQSLKTKQMKVEMIGNNIKVRGIINEY